MVYPGEEYIVSLNPEFSRGGYENLSVHVCPECCALTPEDMMGDHLEWHQRLLTIGTPPAARSV